MSFDQAGWAARWAKVLVTHGDHLANRAPNPHLVATATELPPARALDAGCGHGSEAVWLATRGWHVTGVDFVESALAVGRDLAEAAEVAARTTWLRADLGTWMPPPQAFDLVVCLYVHAGAGVEDLVRRLASAVAVGGTLLMVGHEPVDPATGLPSAAADQVQVSLAAARAALDRRVWSFEVAELRARPGDKGGVDAVVQAKRLAG